MPSLRPVWRRSRSEPGLAASVIIVRKAISFAAGPMSLLRKNIAANYVGRAWMVVMSVAFIPLYLDFLGVEAYGLIGIFFVLQATFSLLDLGLGTTLNRELARRSAGEADAGAVRSLVRSLELLSWVLAAVLAAALILAAPVIASDWVQPQDLDPADIERAIVMMGLALAFRWPLALYTGGLMGLQRHVALNQIIVVASTVQAGGAALVLWWIAPTVEAFFTWQVIAAAAQAGVTMLVLWRGLPRGVGTRFDPSLLRGVWRFAAGITGTTVIAVLMTQLDKLILSRLLSLEALGYYLLAWLLASGLIQITTPVTTALFPRLSQMVELGEGGEFVRLYHRSAQAISVMVAPPAAVLMLFGSDVIRLWTGSAEIAANTAPLLALLAAGTMLNCIMILPFVAQLAHGWTRLSVLYHVAAAVVLVPAVVVLARVYGAAGAATVWLALNAGYVIILIQLMHRRILRGEKRRWYLVDNAAPLVPALVVAGLWRLVATEAMSSPALLAILIGASLTTVLASAAAAPEVRGWFVQRLSRARPAE